jgi:FixJ family two-component response regulator
VIRFVLSGFTDQEMALRSSRVAHQFISKPCETGRLIQIVNHSLDLRELQSNPVLRKITTSINKLPSLPRLYIDLVNELNSPETSLKKSATSSPTTLP